MKNLAILLSLFVLLNGCKTYDDINNDDPIQLEEVAENVIVILEEDSQLISTEIELASGIYKIQFISSPPEIVEDDIIIGEHGFGYLRQVTNVSVTDNLITMETIQATMEDVFGNIEFQISTDLSDIKDFPKPESKK